MNKVPGSVVTVTPKILNVTGWIVEAGSQSFKFVMPEEALKIKAFYHTISMVYKNKKI